jgi:beta-phosphoglucomutase
MKRAIDAALFDLDDVVVRTERYHYTAWKRLSEEEGWSFDREIGMLLRGMPRMQCVEVILKHNGLDIPEDRRHAIASRKNTYLVESLCNLGRSDLLPGVIPFIEKLRSHKIKLGLFSLSQNAGVILESLGLRRYFDVCLTGQDDRCSYYNPDLFLCCAKALSVKPSRCVVFENIDAAAQFALDCDMEVIGVGVPDLLQAVTETIQDFNRADVERLVTTGHVAGDAEIGS